MSVPRRLLVTGNSGSGKTTLAAQLARDLGVPHIELDQLYHGPGWAPADPDEFRAKVRRAAAEPAWVIDGNYTSFVGQVIRERAVMMIALDLPRWRVMSRVARRTLGRLISRAELWNGNKEEWRNLRTLDPETTSCSGPGPSTASITPGLSRTSGSDRDRDHRPSGSLLLPKCADSDIT